jgi:hypothetical protein
MTAIATAMTTAITAAMIPIHLISISPMIKSLWLCAQVWPQTTFP